MLLMYGDRDNFTDVETYRNWAKRLTEEDEERKGDVLSVAEVREADHFWRDLRHRGELCKAVCDWL